MCLNHRVWCVESAHHNSLFTLSINGTLWIKIDQFKYASNKYTILECVLLMYAANIIKIILYIIIHIKIILYITYT